MEKYKIDKILEFGTISEKIDFIDNYNINDNNGNNEFLIQYIKKESLLAKNEWYKIRLIDFAAQLEIIDYNLINEYILFLKPGNSYFLKLTILDYIAHMSDLYNNELIDYSLVNSLLTSKHDRLIVKIQAALLLTVLYPQKKIYYINLIKKFLQRSEDYRAHIRLYNFIIVIDVEIPRMDIHDFVEITNRKPLAKYRSVTATLNELKCYLNRF